MRLNTSNLSHPRMAWEIEAAMWRAVEQSRENLMGTTFVDNARGKPIMVVVHARRSAPAFRFYSEPFSQDITQQVTKALREQAKAVQQ